MNVLRLDNRVGWGNEIHIRTTKGTYAGSGRCLPEEGGIIYKKPELEELKTKVKVNGHCSNPYVKNGDILIYESNCGQEIRFKFRNVNYSRDPHDMFFGDLKYIYPGKKTLIDKVKEWFSRK